MYRALVPIDADEDRALEQARAVAALPDADESVEAVLLYVFADRPHGKPRTRSNRPRTGTFDTPLSFAEEEQAEQTRIEQIPSGSAAKEFLRERNVSVEGECIPGDPAEEILRVAEKIDADIIVLGGRKRSPLGSMLFGSVTQAVVLDADRPVTVTGGG